MKPVTYYGATVMYETDTWREPYCTWAQNMVDRRFWYGYCVQWKHGFKEYRDSVSWGKCVIDDYGNLVGV